MVVPATAAIAAKTGKTRYAILLLIFFSDTLLRRGYSLTLARKVLVTVFCYQVIVKDIRRVELQPA